MASVNVEREQVSCARSGEPYLHGREGDGKAIKAVVCDLDGTLLNSSKTVSERTKTAVRAAMSQGVLFVPASGRSRQGIFHALGDLGEELRMSGAPCISMNGLAVHGRGLNDHGPLLHQSLVSRELARRTVDFWRSHPLASASGVSLLGNCGDTVVVEALDDRARRYFDWKEPQPTEVGPWENTLAEGLELHRLFLWGETQEQLDALRPDLVSWLEDHPAEVTRGIPEMLEVLPPGASKGEGLSVLLQELDIHPGQVVAIGDQENDLEMLRLVGFGVSMGQADASVKDAARFVAPSNDQDGVAVVLETFVGAGPGPGSTDSDSEYSES